jgi:hypothetical protein
MQKYTFWARNLLIVTGVIELAAGSLHFLMPRFAYQSVGFSHLSANEISFVTLCVFAVGILLLAFGCFTLVLSSKIESSSEILFYYVSIKSALWLGRVVLEIVYPVKLKMFSIEPLTIVVLPGVTFEMLLFVVSLVLIRKINQSKFV